MKILLLVMVSKPIKGNKTYMAIGWPELEYVKNYVF